MCEQVAAHIRGPQCPSLTPIIVGSSTGSISTQSASAVVDSLPVFPEAEVKGRR